MPTDKPALKPEQKRILAAAGVAVAIVAVIAILGNLGKEPPGELERIGAELKKATQEAQPARPAQ